MRRRLSTAAALLGLLLASCASSEPSDADVTMNAAQRFEPESITIEVGETLSWENTSREAHTVTAYDDGIPDGAAYFATGGFDDETASRDDIAEGLMEPGDTYEVTFDEPGTYEYFCIPHEALGMTGTVVVEG